MQLYTYYRSSAAYRVRIAMNLKGLAREDIFIHLQRKEQLADDYVQRNPQGFVPTLIDGDVTLGQSLAIIEFLEETHPEPPLLPPTPVERARVRQLALVVAADVHPIANLKVRNYLSEVLGVVGDDNIAWCRHWIGEGLNAFEALLANSPQTGTFCHGDAPGLADVCLIPQVYNARRFELDVAGWPNVARIDAACLAHDAFAAAAPEAQPDAG